MRHRDKIEWQFLHLQHEIENSLKSDEDDVQIYSEKMTQQDNRIEHGPLKDETNESGARIRLMLGMKPRLGEGDQMEGLMKSMRRMSRMILRQE